MTTTDGETLTMRPNVSSIPDRAPSIEDQVQDPVDTRDRVWEENSGIRNHNDDDDGNKDVVTLPQSTHSLLFTEPFCSISFGLGFAVLNITCLSLSFAFVDGLQSGGYGNDLNIPVNVSLTVRGAQYLALLITMIMEEEIPTGLHLLRIISKKSFESKFPDKAYSTFVISCILRIGIGYLFLANVFLVLIRSTAVLEIFYDVMALQFLQQLDDIAFKLAQMDGMLGKTVYRATTSKRYRAEFKKQKGGKKTHTFLKLVYVMNLGILLASMATVSIRQKNGYYQCKEVTVHFGDAVWTNAIIKNSQGEEGKEGERVLLYKYFDGIFMTDGERHDDRLVYKEMRKYDGTPYEIQVGAEIKYCRSEKSWVLTHPYIHKSKYLDMYDSDESGCSSWLLRSPETTSYDLLDVDVVWDVWVGIISQAEVSVICNWCNEDTDCNLNGWCVNGECQCFDDNSEDPNLYLGNHCEVKIDREHGNCETMVSAGETTWYIPRKPFSDEFLQLYNRPVYFYNEGHSNWLDKGIRAVVYSAGRWLVLEVEDYNMSPLDEWMSQYAVEYHAFWDDTYANRTLMVSDPTISSTPVGVDFYKILDRGEQFGPLGELEPLKIANYTGKGFWRCGP